MTSASKPRIGFIGLGTMGNPMATNLLKAGFEVIVWNRTPGKMAPLAKLGAKEGKGPAEVASEVDVTITMVSQPKDIEEVVFRPDGVLDGLKAGSILIDMSTVLPATSRKVAGAVAAKQAEFMDCPVVGSLGPATKGELVILAGGLPGTLERCREILSSMGKQVIHCGDVGMGSTLKLATNLMLAHLMAGFAEAILLIQRAGGDPKKYLEILAGSSFSSPWYGTKGIGVLNRDFNVHFALKHMHKDLRLMGEFAKDVKTALPITKAIEEAFAKAEEQGKAELDYSAIYTMIEGMEP